MKAERTFRGDIDRYLFDFHTRRSCDGWAQCDTWQDAYYFGMWANPFTLRITSYAEGDICEDTAETEAEFVQELRDLAECHSTAAFSFGIDPMGNDEIKRRFEELGLGDLLH